jgi:hypothetical protein
MRSWLSERIIKSGLRNDNPQNQNRTNLSKITSNPPQFSRQNKQNTHNQTQLQISKNMNESPNFPLLNQINPKCQKKGLLESLSPFIITDMCP